MHLGLIGYGNISTALVDLLDKPSRLTVLVRPGRADGSGRRCLMRMWWRQQII